ncbi:MAG: lysophospholipid acyltransferase family protein [Bacteroidales bacterium]|nr:lysophospholipid acyltransferase family protein [Bacteroidales bacterium]
MKKVILNEADLAEMSPAFRGIFGHLFARLFLWIFGVTAVNKVYSELSHLNGCEFTKAWLKRLNVQYFVENEERLSHLPEGAFITVSNHPFGGLDGIILVDMLATKRSDYKFMVNSVLMHVETMSEHFVGVKPVTPKRGSTVENSGALKLTLRHLKSGSPIGFFPAGAVSGYYQNKMEISEKEWQPTIIRLIQSAKVPVIPIYIHGQNSWYFNLLGKINWQLRTTRLSHEVLNKGGQTIKVTVGEIIPWEIQKQYKNIEELADFLRSKTTELKFKK